MSTLPLIQIDLNPTMGAMFVGLLLGSIQSILEASGEQPTAGPRGTLLIKGLKVAMLCSSTRILDTLSLAMIAHGLYIYLISDYMDPLALAYMSWSLSTEPIVSGAVALIVHFKQEMALAVFAIAPFLSSIKTVSGGAEIWLNMPDFKALADAGNIMTSNAMIQLIILYTITTGLLPTLCEHTPRNSRTDCDDKGVAIRLNSRGSIRSRGAETEISAKFSSVQFRARGEPSAASNSSTELDSVTDLPDPVEDGKIGGLMVAAM
ncbi:predicted protein [Postia placenta Mad-698-R]|nr:predicted protein [Postia placenta Mad-698-R]